MRLYFAAALAALTFPLPGQTAPPATLTPVSTPCRNGKQGGMQLSETVINVPGVPPFLSVLASFGEISNCGSEVVTQSVPVDSCNLQRAADITLESAASLVEYRPSPTTPQLTDYDAGPFLFLQSPSREVRLSRVLSGPLTAYQLSLTESLMPTATSSFLVEGDYVLRSDGGRDLGAFSVNFRLGRTQFRAPAAGSVLRPAEIPVIEWTSPESDPFAIWVSASISGANGRTEMLMSCRIATNQSGSFRVPAEIWNAIPQSIRELGTAAFSFRTDRSATVALPGLDQGFTVNTPETYSASICLRDPAQTAPCRGGFQ
jgi:hypothetical protein